MKPLKATEVFTPGILPTHTYYERPNLNLEQSLLDAVDTPGIIATVSGPSKSGKTVLCETVVGVGSMLLVTGGGIDSEDVFWHRIRSRLNAPSSSSTSSGTGQSREIGANAKGGLGLVLKGEAGLTGKLGRSEQQQSTFQFEGLTGVDLLMGVRSARKTLVVDDFHYIDRNVQVSLVEQFKEAARAGCTIAVVSVPHRADDAIRANPDLRGRVRLIEVPYWSEDELLNIPRLGFSKLNVDADSEIVRRFAVESLSSPQLMQSLCLDLCRDEHIDEQQNETRKIVFDEEKLKTVLRTIATTSSGQTALDILEKGPRVRGTERNNYELTDGAQGDVYTVVIRALATGNPRLSLSYPQIRELVGQVTKGSRHLEAA